MSDENSCVNKCPFFILFIKQLFDIGNSTGSMIGEALNLFRLFQRLSATKRFSTKFSIESLSWFKWATDFVNKITSHFAIKPFSNLENFLIVSISIPLFIFTFIPTLLDGYSFSKKMMLLLFVIPLGFGLGLFDLEKQDFFIGGIIIGASIFIFLMFLFIYYCRYKNLKIFDFSQGAKSSNFEEQESFQFTNALISAISFFLLSMIPILFSRGNLAIIVGAICGIVTLISFTIEMIEYCCYRTKKQEHFKKYSQKVIAFLVNCLSLLIIPSTEAFTELMHDLYQNHWVIITCYVVISLIFPIVTTFMLIYGKYSEVCDKYKRNENSNINLYCYIELVDIIRQVIYAIVSAYDIIWGCIGIEAAWILLLIITRPFSQISEYANTFFSSLVLFIGNGATLYAEAHNTQYFSFKVAVGFVILAIIPAIVSAYLYFIFDFELDINSLNENVEISKWHANMVYYISLAILPISWCLSAAIIPQFFLLSMEY